MLILAMLDRMPVFVSTFNFICVNFFNCICVNWTASESILLFNLSFMKFHFFFN